MPTTAPHDDPKPRFPRSLLWVVVAVCVLPAALHGLGLDLATHGRLPDRVAVLELPTREFADALHHGLAGSFVHTLLEWTAVCTAVFTVLLAFIHFSVRRDHTAPLIGVALLCTGCMDAFHTLAADRLVESVADHRDLVPFTWALSRMFNATILVGGVFLLTLTPGRRPPLGLRHVLAISALMVAASVLIIGVSVSSPSLPHTQFPDATVTRPFDVLPLVVYGIGAAYVMPRFRRQRSCVFADALIVSMIPQIATQVHMAFWSSELHDAHFNIAHFLKIVAYLVPFVGLCIDYVETHRRERGHAAELARRNQELQRRNQELDEFTYAASHDLQEPLRKLTSFTRLLMEDVPADKLSDDARNDLHFIVSAATRMRTLVHDLLDLSRAGRSEMQWKSVALQTCVNTALDNLSGAIGQTEAEVQCVDLPVVRGDERLLTQVLQNLIGNAIKFVATGRPRVRLSARRTGAVWTVAVEDDGIGIPPEHRARVFAPFQRLHGRETYDGTGIGLAICQRAIERHGGKIWVDEEHQRGTRILFTLSAVAGEAGEGRARRSREAVRHG